jgi:hypothetical protein
MTSATVRRLVLRLAGVGALAVSTGARPAMIDASARVVVEQYPNGQTRRISHYRGDKLDGESRGWFASGARQFVYVYRSGLSEGEQRQWFPTGQIFTLFHHRAGHEDGQQQMWNADGTIRSNYVIKDGRRFGLLGAMGCTGKDSVAAAALAAGDMQ